MNGRTASIILSHFILDLRYDPEEHSDVSAGQTSVRFASRVEGNLGASLNSIWGSGIQNDSEDEEGARDRV